MIKNYLYIALRSIRKARVTSAINILGLSVGMAVALLIFTYAHYELSYDRFHENADFIHRVSIDILSDGNFQLEDAQCYPALGPMAVNDFSEIDDFAMISSMGRLLFKRREKAFNEDRAYLANPGWLTVFDWKLTSGDRNTALNEANTVVISQSTAKKYFGNENPLGQELITTAGEGEIKLVVKGIFEDVPENTHLGFDLLISWEIGHKYMKRDYNTWYNNDQFV